MYINMNKSKRVSFTERLRQDIIDLSLSWNMFVFMEQMLAPLWQQ